MGNYGMPYQGSKSKIAEKLINVLPAADCFVDLFGGGGAMTDCASKSGKYKKVMYNELDPLVYKGFKLAINGEFKSESRWISREDFNRLKDSDTYVAICFSFGNGLKNYCYSQEVERLKKHLHYIFFAETPNESRTHWRAFIREFDKIKQEIADLTQVALKLCGEHNVTPLYNCDRTLNAKKLKAEVFKSESEGLRRYFRSALASSGLTQADVDRHLGNQMSGHYFGSSQWMLPTAEQYKKMQEIIPMLDKPWTELNEKLQVVNRLDELQSLQSMESLQSLQSLESLERLERLQSLERLERLQSLERLETKEQILLHNLSYEQVIIPDNSIVYCDSPYINTNEYRCKFNHDKFYEWARKTEKPIFISEYQMPDDFKCIAQFDKTCTYAAVNSNKKTTEKLFCNPYAEARLKDYKTQYEILA